MCVEGTLPLWAPGLNLSGPLRSHAECASKPSHWNSRSPPVTGGCPRDGGSPTLDLGTHQVQSVSHGNWAVTQWPRGCTVPPGGGGDWKIQGGIRAGFHLQFSSRNILHKESLSPPPGGTVQPLGHWVTAQLPWLTLCT